VLQIKYGTVTEACLDTSTPQRLVSEDDTIINRGYNPNGYIHGKTWCHRGGVVAAPRVDRVETPPLPPRCVSSSPAPWSGVLPVRSFIGGCCGGLRQPTQRADGNWRSRGLSRPQASSSAGASQRSAGVSAHSWAGVFLWKPQGLSRASLGAHDFPARLRWFRPDPWPTLTDAVGTVANQSGPCAKSTT